MSIFIPFEIARSSFEDLKQRLKEKGSLEKHLSQDTSGEEIIIFGATAFCKEAPKESVFSSLFSKPKML